MESLLDPIEELTLDLIKEQWIASKQKFSIAELNKELTKKGMEQSPEKTRLIIEALWSKGEILIDVQGRERMIRPNHVIVNSKTSPIAFRNFTIVDQNSGEPLQRIWVSVYKEDGKKYFSISESRWNGSWKTTSNIIIPPDAVEEFKTITQFITDNI